MLRYFIYYCWCSLTFGQQIMENNGLGVGCRACIYGLKVNNRNTWTMCEICSQLTTKIPDVVDVVLMSLLLTLNRFDTLSWCSNCWRWTSKCRLRQHSRSDFPETKKLVEAAAQPRCLQAIAWSWFTRKDVEV